MANPLGYTARAVTPSDTTLIGGCRALYIGGAGNLTLDFPDASNVVFTAVPVGTTLCVSPLRVKAATTATLIVALY